MFWTNTRILILFADALYAYTILGVYHIVVQDMESVTTIIIRTLYSISALVGIALFIVVVVIGVVVVYTLWVCKKRVRSPSSIYTWRKLRNSPGDLIANIDA